MGKNVAGQQHGLDGSNRLVLQALHGPRTFLVSSYQSSSETVLRSFTRENKQPGAPQRLAGLAGIRLLSDHIATSIRFFFFPFFSFGADRGKPMVFIGTNNGQDNDVIYPSVRINQDNHVMVTS